MSIDPDLSEIVDASASDVHASPKGARVTRTAQQLLSKPPPPTTVLLEPSFVVRDGITTVSAPSKVGKTQFWMHVAYAMTEGATIWGVFEAPAPVRVLLLELELSEAVVHQRLDVLRRELTWSSEALARLTIRCERAITLNRVAGQKYVTSIIEETPGGPPDVVILDSFNAAVRGDPDKTGDARDALHALHEIQEATGITWCLTNEMRKSPAGTFSRFTLDDIKGNNELVYDADTVVILRPTERTRRRLSVEFVGVRHDDSKVPEALTLVRRGLTFDVLAHEERGRLAKVQERMTAFSESIASGFATGSDLISGLIDLQSELTEEGGPGFSGADMQTFLADQVAQSQDFASALRALQDAGLDPGLLADLASRGPEALPFIQALLDSGPEVLAEFNAAATAIADIASATSEDLATEEFGKALDKARDALGALGERIEGVMARLEARLVKFIEGIRADTTAKKFDELNRSLDRLLQTLSSGTFPHFAKGGIVRRPTLALIGEAGPEAVVPLSSHVLASARPASTSSRPVVVEVPSGPLAISGYLQTPLGLAYVRGVAREQDGAQRAFDERIQRAGS